MRIVTKGRARPSFRPLSTLRALRTTAGTRGLATTACPRAASVGARITPIRAACQSSRPPKTATAATAPATIVSGSPMPRSRPDRLGSRVQRRMSRLDESAKRTITRAASSRRIEQLPIRRQLDDAEHGAAEDADDGEEDRCRDDRRCQALRDEGVRQDRQGDEDQRMDHVAVPPRARGSARIFRRVPPDELGRAPDPAEGAATSSASAGRHGGRTPCTRRTGS